MPDRSNLIGSRLDFARVCNDRNYKIAVEVGTDRGIFARQFLDVWLGEILYCVDPYEPSANMPWNRDADLALAFINLTPHAMRTRMLLCPSVAAAGFFGRLHDFPSLVDFVYIDGCHNAHDVYKDIAAWWDKLRPGGLLAGDDYGRVNPGVKLALEQWLSVAGAAHKVQLTTDYNREPSWFIEKPL